MKIRTITCHHVYNHGAYLQAYALVKYLQGIGHDAAIIDYRPKYKNWNPFVFPHRFNNIFLNGLYFLAKLPQNIQISRRHLSFDRFFAKYMPIGTPTYNTLEELRANPPKADLYIAGSDQIWNTYFTQGTDEAFYLGFGSARKISYAASFATDSIKAGSEHLVKSYLSNFDSISVREQGALTILDKLGYSGKRVVDPAFLLTCEEWNYLATDSCYSEKYILIYDFYHSQAIERAAKLIASKRNIKIYSIGPYNLNYVDKNFTKASPRTFIQLVRDSECVISNSFHGSVFSIIYKKDFFVADRRDGLNQRMYELLKRYHLMDRHISVNTTEDDLLRPINWAESLTILSSDIEASKKFLDDNIH